MWWLIFPIAAFFVIFGVVVQDHYNREMEEIKREERNNTSIMLNDDCADDPYDIECETSDIPILKQMEYKIKLEDMTLKQIRGLKQQIVDEIHFAINKATSGYDVGGVVLLADADVDDLGGNKVLSNPITIKFGDEL